MKARKLIPLLLLAVLFLSYTDSKAQVKIGGSPVTPINASSILHIDDSSKGFLMPVMNVTRRDAITSPAEGLLIYNKTSNNINLFSSGAWRGLNTDTSEWKFDTASKRVYLIRSLAVGDTTFYDTTSHKFFFGDRRIYTNSLNQDIPAEAFGGKSTFKATASKSSRDSATAATSALLAMYEIDNSDQTFTNGSYSAISAITTVNPKSFQKPFITGISNNTLNAGNDTAFQQVGFGNFTTNRSVAYTEATYGIQNQQTISAQNTGNFGTIFGISNIANRSVTATGRILGSYYGYYNVMTSAVATRIDGPSYGIYLSNAAGALGGNYAIYTNAGRNRFGDSVLIGLSTVPRAFVDINNTSSMIIPTGNTAQRPVTGVIGMTRFNTDNGGNPETYNGAQWVGTIRNTTSIDIPSILPGASFTTTITVNGATTGSSVSISPTNALAAGLVIAYARVSAVNTVEVRFTLLPSATGVDPAPENYYIRVMQ
jgi:hypothetical protein